MNEKDQCGNCIHYTLLGRCMGKGIKASFDWCPEHVRIAKEDRIMR